MFGQSAGYAGVNEAERHLLDSTMRTTVDSPGLDQNAAPTSEMGGFDAEWLASKENFAALAGQALATCLRAVFWHPMAP